MQEIVTNLLNQLSGLVPGVETSILLGICGGIIIFVLFLLSLAIAAGCKITRYRKQLIESTKTLHDQPAVSDENVGALYDEISKHPDGVQKGWQCFMDQRVGYPSDYIVEKNVLGAREYSGKGAFAKVFLILLGAIVWALVGVIGFMSKLPESDTVMSAIVSLEFIIIPIAMYVICILLLDIAFNRKIRRLQMAFISFLEMLDSKVVVSDKDEREFVSDNLDEINRRVAEIIAGREEDDEVIEVITAPKIEEIEEVTAEEEEAVMKEAAELEEEPEVEPEEEEEDEPYDESLEIVKEPVETVEEPEEVDSYEEPEIYEEEEPQPRIIAEMTEDERENYFKLLIELVDRAIADENCGDDDYAMIAAAINDEAISSGAVNDPEDMAIFEDCFRRLAERISE